METALVSRSPTTMAYIEKMPHEVSMMILCELDDFILPVLHASPHLRRVLSTSAARRQLLLKKIGPIVLPLACALNHAEGTNWEPEWTDVRDGIRVYTEKGIEEYTRKILAFCSEHLTRPYYSAGFPNGAYMTMDKMIQMHEFNVHAERMIPYVRREKGVHAKHREALEKARASEEIRYPSDYLRPRLERAPPKLLPWIEPEKWTRYIRSIYIFELARIILPYHQRKGRDNRLPVVKQFWSFFAPWECHRDDTVSNCISTHGRDAGGSNPDSPGWTSQETRCENIALQLGVRHFHLIAEATDVPSKYITFANQMSRAKDHPDVDYSEVTRFFGSSMYKGSEPTARELLPIIQRFDDQTSGMPARIWIWMNLYGKRPLSNPSKGYTLYYRYRGRWMSRHAFYKCYDRLENVFSGIISIPEREELIKDIQTRIENGED
ncbi:hypothetical protein GGR52DRAFT_545359 [Hypoxylon sp. FL1284]|nr:hypothetical protein GGR52DRAFT_545359 [Hypoxylon sp. FL1284]